VALTARTCEAFTTAVPYTQLNLSGMTHPSRWYPGG